MHEGASELKGKILDREAVIGIIGLGYVGLPLVKLFLAGGFKVIGFDVDQKKVDALNQGRSYIKHVSAEDLIPRVKQKRFRASTDFSLLKRVDVVVICVPTPLDGHRNPDLTYVLDTSRTIKKHLKKGHLIILESTTFPGTTDEILLPIFEEGGWTVGRDYFLAYSPERENPGDEVYTTDRIPKVVGGITSDCRRLAETLYKQIVGQVVPVGSTREAEAAKILENIFRSVNIALVNEMKMIFDRMGIDVWEVIRAASTKPFGFMPFYPGPGYGGHCIPVDPFYLAWKAKEVEYPTKFIELAGEINTQMPYFVVDKTSEALNVRGKSLKGSKILVLGVAYKKDVDDQRESPALKIIDILRKKGAAVSYHDPYVPQSSGHRAYPDLKLKSVALTDRLLAASDAVIIATDHSFYDFDHIVETAGLVIDTRNAVKKKRKNVVKA